MKFKKGFLIHKRFLDIAFEVLDVDEAADSVVLKVFTWNRGWTGNPWMVPKVSQPSKVIIRAADFGDWEYVDTLERHAAP